MTVRELLDLQAGVVARRQLYEAGLKPYDVRRMIRQGRLVVVRPGVYVNHTGELTWLQRAWAEVLNAWPAALSHRSAIRVAHRPTQFLGGSGPIHVAVARTRSLDQPDGVRLHRVADLAAKVQWNQGVPRVRIEHAVLDVAAEARDEFEAISTLADAVQGRLTQTTRIQAALATRSRIARRDFLDGALADIGSGTCSVLEHGYLDRVERPHGLPRARRQLKESERGPLYRDADYEDYGVLVELDGRLFHDNAEARDADLDRDLDATIDGRVTVRLGWGQVFRRACTTAGKVAQLLQQHGWGGDVPVPRLHVDRTAALRCHLLTPERSHHGSGSDSRGRDADSQFFSGCPQPLVARPDAHVVRQS